MTKDKYQIAVEALHRIARREHCSCGCPNSSTAAPIKPIVAYMIARVALDELGEPDFVMALDFTDPKPTPEFNSGRKRIPKSGYGGIKFVPQITLD